MAKKIMLVEDDNNLREIYEARLSAEGYEIVAAENGEAALAMAAKERPDMIISDVMMPKISGFEMLDILRNTDSLKNTKIIMLTALGQSEDSQRADSLGADRYLVKSQVTLEDIVKAAHDLLDDPNTLAVVPDSATGNNVNPEVESAAPIAAQATPAPAESANEPAPVAEAPAEEPVSTVAAPVDSPVAAEPTQAPEPAAATVPVSPSDNTPGVALAPEPIVGAAEPAADTSAASVVTDVPAEPPVAAPGVISIPVTDADGDGSQPSAPAPTGQASQAVPTDSASDMQVVEPPAEDEPAAAQPETGVPSGSVETTPADQGSTEPAVADTAPNDPVTGPVAEPAAQATAIEDQINAFINNQNTEAPASVAPAAAPAPETDAADPSPQPSVEIPSVVANPNIDISAGIDISDEELAAGPADDVPTPEQLNTFTAPVIDAPEGSTVPEPQDVPVPQAAPETAADVNNADQLREAAEGMADAASTEAAQAAASSSTATNRMRTIAPVTSAENKPTIHQLLELEEAKNAATQAAQVTQEPRPNVDAYNPSAQPAPQQPQNNQTIDPNSISL